MELPSEFGLRNKELDDLARNVLYGSETHAQWKDATVPGVLWFRLLREAKWFEVYEFAQALLDRFRSVAAGDILAERLNRFFINNGYGWKVEKGLIVTRGSATFEQSVDQADGALALAGMKTSRELIASARRLLSLRPEPDARGAINNAISALEALVKEISGDRNRTLGELIKDKSATSRLGLHPALADVISKLYGFTSDQTRHGREGQSVDRSEAEFLIVTASAIIVLVLERAKPASA